MNKDLIAIFEYLEKEKGVKREVIIAAIEESLQAAALKSVKGAANVSVNIDPKTGDINVFCEKEIVNTVTNPSQEILFEDATEIDPDCQLGQFIDVKETPENFGRIAAQNARQIISQKLRSAERDVIHEEYRHRIGELVSGTVKRFVRGNKLIVDMGKVEGAMPLKFYPKTERYRVGDRVLALLWEVSDTDEGGAEVVLTRSHPEFVKQLFIQEVPEIADGTVTIDNIVRDAGYRTKLTVRSTDSKVDPVGACVGMRGMRVKNVVRELNNEKIDIIPFSSDPVQLLENALDPIEIRKICISDDEESITIVVADDDFPVAIGKRHMNAYLNGQLIGKELTVQKISEYNKEMAVRRLELSSVESPDLEQKIESIPGLSNLVFEHLESEGLNTPRALLALSQEKLTAMPGVSPEVADRIFDHMLKQYAYLLECSNDEVEEEEMEEIAERVDGEEF